MKTYRTSSLRPGFSIVELLTVMGVIAILIALLVPALGMVKDYSKEIQQKSQFHSMEAALQMFNTDFGMYPPSNDNFYAGNTPYCGANKLAEALVGRDMLGFHPNSDFTSNGVNDVIVGGVTTPVDLYNLSVTTYQTAEENIDSRKGPYIELENANAFRMEDVYDDWGTFTNDMPVVCDVFAKKRTSGVKTGMPILYYRARAGMTFQDSTDTLGIADDIFNYEDNENLLLLGRPEDKTLGFPLADGATGSNPNSGPSVSQGDYEDFEDIILNKNLSIDTDNDGVADTGRPYRAGSYILISAGKDGLYGTSDDITNFTRE